MSMNYDVLIIGGGAAGKDAALLAARAGLETLLIEKEKLGGTSYHKGCYVIRALQKCAQSFRASQFSMLPILRSKSTSRDQLFTMA